MMMNDREFLPFVSFIIPMKNEEDYISSCLDSVFSINYPTDRFEVIVVDNLSTDTSVILCERYKVKLYSYDGKTVGSVRNFGVSQANGEVLVFLDADCVIYENFLMKALEALCMKDVCAVGFISCVEISSSTWVERCWAILNKILEKDGGLEVVKWLPTFNLSVWRRCFEDVGGFDETLQSCEDVDLSNKLNRTSRLIRSSGSEVIHLGEDKSVKELFMKEIWRGEGAFSNLISSREFNASSIASVFIPIFYVLVNSLFMLNLLLLKTEILLPLLLIILFFPFFYCFYKIRTTIHLNDLISLMLFFFVYLNSRGIAFFVYCSKLGLKYFKLNEF